MDPSPNSYHSTNEESIIIDNSRSIKCPWIEPVSVEISRFRNVPKSWVVKKKWDVIFPRLNFIFE